MFSTKNISLFVHIGNFFPLSVLNRGADFFFLWFSSKVNVVSVSVNNRSRVYFMVRSNYIA